MGQRRRPRLLPYACGSAVVAILALAAVSPAFAPALRRSARASSAPPPTRGGGLLVSAPGGGSHGQRRAGSRWSWPWPGAAARIALAAAAAGAAAAVSSRRADEGEFPELWRSLFWPDSPVLRGNFAPVADEQTGTPLTVVEGAVPEGFPAGAFVRNGPNPRGFRPGSPYHWFEGPGMLHKVHFHGAGRAPEYSNRWVRTKKFEADAAMPFPIWGGEISRALPVTLSNMFVNWLMRPLLAAFGGGTDVTGNANTTVVVHAGRMVAITETDPPAEVDLRTLETLGTVAWEGARGEPITAHPKSMPSGDLRWFCYRTAGEPQVTYGVLDAEGASLHRSVVPVESNNLLHDMAATDRWSILVDGGLTWPPPSMDYDKTKPLRFGLLPRLGGECRWLEAKPGMVIHVLNAYEEGEDVVVTGCRFDDFDLFPAEDGKVFVDPNCLPRLWEWRLHLADGSVSERRLSQAPMDFPRLNESYVGLRHRWGYAARIAAEAQLEAGAPLFDALVKFDLASDSAEGSVAPAQVHSLAEREFCGEGVFVPREGAAEEDDGWVVCLTHDERRGASELRIVDARDFAGPPVCRIAFPRRVPYGFHGAWVPEAAVAARAGSR